MVICQQDLCFIFQEMMYMWNGYSMIRKQPELTEGIMETLLEAERTLQAAPGNATQCPLCFK